MERVDFCDETSLEFIAEFLPQIIESQISFVFTSSENFALHKKIPEFLYSEKYKNITVYKSNFQDLLTKVQDDVLPLLNTEYIPKLRAASNGNIFQYKNIIQYLKDTQILFKGKDDQYPAQCVCFPSIQPSVSASWYGRTCREISASGLPCS